MRTVRSISSLGRNFIVFCLAVAFALSAVGTPSPDRLTRRQQRSRSQRQSRQRVCTSLSQGPAAYHSVFQRSAQPSDPPPAILAAALPLLTFASAELVVPPAAPRHTNVSVHPPTLPRPPPALA